MLAPALEAAGHELVELDEADAMVDFTAPDAALPNIQAAIEAGVPCVVGTSGLGSRKPMHDATRCRSSSRRTSRSARF